MRANVRDSVQLPKPTQYSFDGDPCTGADLQMYGMFTGCSSIANCSTAFARSLREAASKLALHSYNGSHYFDPALQELAGIDPYAPIGLFYGMPDSIRGRVLEHDTLIGGFVCETDVIPSRWVEMCNRFDLIVVPSRYCKNSFVRSGVATPILVVPHGLEAEYQPVATQRPSDRFVFYDVMNSRFPIRKGLEDMLRAFRSAFGERPDVKLRLRLERLASVRRILAECRVRPDDLQIHIDSSPLPTTAAFAATYSHVHCTVHPAHSEGFGLIPFQSIACETPVIAANSTGMADYLDKSNAMLLRTKGMAEDPDVYYATGAYPLIDRDHLVELMRHAEKNWEAEVSKARSGGPKFRERHSWNAALTEFASLITELLGLADASQRRALIAERVGGGRDRAMANGL